MTDPFPPRWEAYEHVVRLTGGVRLAEIRLWSEPAASSRVADRPDLRWDAVSLSTFWAAEYHLRGLIRCSQSVLALRALLGHERHDVQRMPDTKVISEVATLLARGRYILYEASPPLDIWIAPSAGTISYTAPAPAPARHRTAASPSPIESPAASPPDLEPDNMNHDAQAATLRAAARDAVPFCEICERLAAASQEAVPA